MWLHPSLLPQGFNSRRLTYSELLIRWGGNILEPTNASGCFMDNWRNHDFKPLINQIWCFQHVLRCFNIFQHISTCLNFKQVLTWKSSIFDPSFDFPIDDLGWLQDTLRSRADRCWVGKSQTSVGVSMAHGGTTGSCWIHGWMVDFRKIPSFEMDDDKPPCLFTQGYPYQLFGWRMCTGVITKG